MYIGNIPQELRISRKKKGAAILLDYVPEVRKAGLIMPMSQTEFKMPGKSGDTDAALADHRAKVYHATLLKILESAATAARETGFKFRDGQCYRLTQLIIAILSGDYEE
jgi:hypothetical protein